MNARYGGMANVHSLIETWNESLLRACWQGALLIAAIAILCRAVTRLPANARCALWWLACLKLLLGLVPFTPVAVPLTTRGRLLPLATSVLAIWLIGALFRLAISLIPLRRVEHLLGTATVVNDSEVQKMMEGIAKELGLRQAPCLLLSETATEPLAVS